MFCECSKYLAVTPQGEINKFARQSLLTLYTQSQLLANFKKKSFKTLWGKEKMLVTSTFSFSNDDFYTSRDILQFLSHNYFVTGKCFQFGVVSK